MHPRPAIALALFAALAPALSAQQSKVIPQGMDFVEGPLVYTYPFGRADGAIQVLVDADQLTLGQGLILGIRFRPSQVSGTQTQVAHTKNYRVTAYVVSQTAATMVADLAANIGSATGTVVFQGPVNLPAQQILAVAPAPFSIHIPFSQPFAYDGALGNLLLHVETADTAAVPGLYRIDAVQFRNSVVEGIVAAVDTAGCTVPGTGAGMTMGASATTAIVGGAITNTLTESAPGSFTSALVGLALDRQQQDLSFLGMPGCTNFLGTFTSQVAVATGGVFPPVNWNIPALPSIAGIPCVTQALALPANGNFASAVTSNALAIRIGSSAPPVNKVMAAFRSSTGWFIGTVGSFSPVMQFEGLFP